MSTVTYVTQYKGVAKKGEGHYSLLYLDVKKRISQEYRRMKQLAAESPNLYADSAKWLEKVMKNPRLYNSGTVENRIAMRMMTVTPENTHLFVQELTPFDEKRFAYSDTKGVPIAYIDFDNRIVYDAKDTNGFLDFRYTLPDGWRYVASDSKTLENWYQSRRKD